MRGRTFLAGARRDSRFGPGADCSYAGTRCLYCRHGPWIVGAGMNVCLESGGHSSDHRRSVRPRAAWPTDAEAERAAQLAEAALERCIFLGDSLEVPERGEILHMRGSAHELGSLTWFDSRGEPEFGVNWSDLIALEVRPVDTPGQEISDWRSLTSPFGWFGRQRARDAVLSVQATWGRVDLLVEGRTPAELEAALVPLRACIGRPVGVAPASDPPPRNER